MPSKSPLDDPETAAYAWRRFRRLMLLVAATTAVTIAVALLWLHSLTEPVSIHYYIAAALGIGITMMMGGALMGLMFLSSGTGHDDSVER
ncbi:hypothetical protein GRI58_04310 [Porphyrobacter algicida]|uniref:Uncharacterized protein n=1 Tax=Qipengyuania algicida TaxID=1836209 RepID=A0A845AEE7_9SPHN|nr:hypothetical protein [Qipengyuania algicida]MXP28044.1 hypothetical protein [Qipengyuania algicida]